MSVLAAICFALAVLGGTAVLAGVLWMVFAQTLWGHPVGPPLNASPEEARAWRARREESQMATYALNWPEVKARVAAGHWHEVWPILFVVGGVPVVLFFLPLGILVGTHERWVGLGGLVMGLVLIWRGYVTLTRGQKG